MASRLGLKAAVEGRKVATTGQRDVRKGTARQGGERKGRGRRKERKKEGRGWKTIVICNIVGRSRKHGVMESFYVVLRDGQQLQAFWRRIRK